MDDTWRWGLQLAATVAIHLALAAITGCLVAVAILTRDVSKWASARLERLADVVRAATAVCLAATVLSIWGLAAVMSELSPIASLGSVPSVLMETHAGHSWALALVPLVILLSLMLLRRGGRRDGPLLGVGVACIVAFAACKSWSGHAGVTGEVIPFLADWIHFLSGGVWAGIVLISATVALRGPPPEDHVERDDCAGFVRVLSETATAALATVVVTGAFGAWRSLGRALPPANGSDYEVILVVKITFVVVAVGIGAYNRFVVMPRLLASLRGGQPSSNRPLQTFQGVLAIESVVLAIVLVLAAILSMTPPPSLSS